MADNIDELIIDVALSRNGREDYYAGRNIEKEMEAIARGEEKAVKSGDKLERTNQRLAKSNRAVANSGFQLGKALRFIGGFLGAKALMSYADTWSQIGSQLSLITESDKERLSIQEKIYEIAQKTRQEMPATVDLYSKLTNNAQNLGLSEEKRLQLTSLINKSLAIGGGNPQDNQRVLLQFGQALGIGKFAGQDLKAITQGNQGFAKIIAKGLGVDIGQLPEMGQKGLLTSEKVINAILKQNDEINESFTKIKPTIGSAFTNLNNAFGRLVSKFGETTGVVTLLTQSIDALTRGVELVSNNIKLFTKIVIPMLLLRSKLLRTALINGGVAMRYMEMRARGLSVAMGGGLKGVLAFTKAFLKLEAIFWLFEQIKKFLDGEDNIFTLIASFFQSFEDMILDWLRNLPEDIQVGIKGALQGMYQILEDIFGTLFGWIVNFFHHGKPTDETKKERDRRQEFERKLYYPNIPQTPVASSNSNVSQTFNVTVNESKQGMTTVDNIFQTAIKTTTAGEFGR